MGDFEGGTSGAGVTLRHDQARLFGSSLSNTLWLQCAQGSAGLTANLGDLSAGSQVRALRHEEPCEVVALDFDLPGRGANKF